MSTTYKYQGEYLTDFIAVELVIELFAGRNDIPLAHIRDSIENKHINSGGLCDTFTDESRHPVSKATYILKRMRFAFNPKQGYWSFCSIDDMIDHLESLK